VKNNPTKFHSDQIWNDGAIDIFEEGRRNKNKKGNISKKTGSVPDPKCHFMWFWQTETLLALRLAEFHRDA